MPAPAPDPSVRAVLDDNPSEIGKTLHRLRDLVYDTAEQTEGCGRLVETLKWGQVSFLTQAPKSGSTLRIGPVKDKEAVALYVHCQTDLTEQFKTHYEDRLNIVGKRLIEIPTDQPLPEDALAHCIALTLTYHQRKRR